MRFILGRHLTAAVAILFDDDCWTVFDCDAADDCDCCDWFGSGDDEWVDGIFNVEIRAVVSLWPLASKRTVVPHTLIRN